ncbi:MAG: helix-turn-helix domain-containing protein [Thermoleophilaceae bacterium]|nr:helix-turn-helix domain-containing protein [Thermoleophilaceae bacterium]
MSRKPTTTTDSPNSVSVLHERWLTRRQIAEHYGFSVRWVVRQTAAGMPGHKICGEYRYRLSEVDAWLGVQQTPIAA